MKDHDVFVKYIFPLSQGPPTHGDHPHRHHQPRTIPDWRDTVKSTRQAIAVGSSVILYSSAWWPTPQTRAERPVRSPTFR